jgi:hypothetical protein
VLALRQGGISRRDKQCTSDACQQAGAMRRGKVLGLTSVARVPNGTRSSEDASGAYVEREVQTLEKKRNNNTGPGLPAHGHDCCPASRTPRASWELPPSQMPVSLFVCILTRQVSWRHPSSFAQGAVSRCGYAIATLSLERRGAVACPGAREAIKQPSKSAQQGQRLHV